MIVAKGKIGVTNIPIFETTIFFLSIIGIRLAFNTNIKLKTVIFIDITIESIFLVSLYIVLSISNDLAKAGLVVYGVIIAKAIIDEIILEVKRSYEDNNMTTASNLKMIKKLRKLKRTYSLIAGGLGSIISLIFLTYIKMNLHTFVIIMLSLNVAQNIYDYYILHRYLRT
jgi:hypothetical protein